jgi:hypothetical protein
MAHLGGGGGECYLPDCELVPAARIGEAVVFLAHFEHVLGLPVSTFLRDFLDFSRRTLFFLSLSTSPSVSSRPRHTRASCQHPDF